MKKLILLTDLGRIRVVEWTSGEELEGDRDRFSELEEIRWGDGTPSYREAATDQSGRFGRGGMPGRDAGMSYGDKHELERELRRRQVSELADRVSGIVTSAGCPRCYLAAPRPILKALESQLSADAFEAIRLRIPVDLTKEPLAQLRERFASA